MNGHDDLVTLLLDLGSDINHLNKVSKCLGLMSIEFIGDVVVVGWKQSPDVSCHQGSSIYCTFTC